jgi:hypothetical protein
MYAMQNTTKNTLSIAAHLRVSAGLMAKIAVAGIHMKYIATGIKSWIGAPIRGRNGPGTAKRKRKISAAPAV